MGQGEALETVGEAGAGDAGAEAEVGGDGQVQFGVIADRQLVPKPAELVELIVTEFERLVFLVLLGAGSLAA